MEHYVGLKEELVASLAVPSTTHTYSVITDYIRSWFLEKFPNEMFKRVHIENKHVFDDFRQYTESEKLKVSNPSVAIIPRINLEYNRGMLDTNQFGLDSLVRTGSIRQSIIRDFERNLFIGHTMESLEIRYGFIVKVESKAQQIDMYKYINMAFPIGHIFETELNMDYHLPLSLMLQLANDSGFEVVNGKVVDIVGFVKHVNKISRLPVTFKYRTLNGNSEFFIRFPDLDIRIDLTNQLSADDGERRGMIQKTYRLEFEITVMAPTPKFFTYYSSNRHELISSVNSISKAGSDTVIYPIYTIEMLTIPKINTRGWNQYIITEYYEDRTSEPIVMEFEPLFEGGSNIAKVISFDMAAGYNPDNYIEFMIFNGTNHRAEHTVDWDALKVTINDLVENPTSHISIYIDTDYVNERLKDIDNHHNTRYEK